MADANATTANASPSLEEAAAGDSDDLINLDTTNSSFELEDFDPLNDKAKPIPSTTTSKPAVPVVPSYAPIGFNNPIYPYFTPTHLHKAQHQHHHQHSLSHGGSAANFNAGLGSGSGANALGRTASVQDDFELLRNYGLDKFSLIDGAGGGQEKQQHHLVAGNGTTSGSRFGGYVNGGATRPASGGGGSTSGTTIAGGSSRAAASFSNWTTFD